MLKEPSQPQCSRVPRKRSLASTLADGTRVWLEKCKERAESAREYRIQQLMISGTERSSGELLRTSYFGTGNHLPYIQDWIYGERSIVGDPRQGSVWGARRWATEDESKADLLVADLPSPYDRLLPRRRFLQCPAWLNQRLPLGPTWEDVRAGFRKSAKTTILRRIRKYQLGDRFTREPNAVADFYHEMYVPYLRARFREAAFIEPFDRIQWFVDNGALLQIVRDGEVIAAAVLYGWGKTLDFLWVGLRNDLRDTTSAGAFGALYYYGIRYAFEKGFDEVDLSGTRALLNDGVYRFKRQWGAQVHDGWCLDSLLLQPRNLDVPVAAFLERSPMIVRQPRGLAGALIFARSAPTVEDLQHIKGLYSSEGIRGMKLVSLSAVEQEVREAAESSSEEIQLLDLSRDPNPLTTLWGA